MKDFAIDSLLSMSPASLSAPPPYGPENKTGSFDEHLSRASRPQGPADESKATDSRSPVQNTSNERSREKADTDDDSSSDPNAIAEVGAQANSTTESRTSDESHTPSDEDAGEEFNEEEGDDENAEDVIVTQSLHATQQELLKTQVEAKEASEEKKPQEANENVAPASATPNADGALLESQLAAQSEAAVDDSQASSRNQKATPETKPSADDDAKVISVVALVDPSIITATDSQSQSAIPVAPQAEGGEQTDNRKPREKGAKNASIGKPEGRQAESTPQRPNAPAERKADIAVATTDADKKSDGVEVKALVQAGSDHKPGDVPSQQSNTPARINSGGPLSSARNEHASSTGVSDVDRVRFVQRVARAFQAADEQGGSVRLRLSPPELGSMRLEVTIRDGVLTARMETETQAAKNLLLDHMPVLRERLAEQNIRVERFEVDLMQQHSGGLPDRPGENTDGSQYRQQHQPIPNRRTVETPTSPVTAKRTVAAAGNSQLNIVI